MQNKSAVWTFTILLTLACLFQISYSWVTNSVENDAVIDAQNQYDSIEATGQSTVYYGSDTFNIKEEIDQENLKRRLEEDYLRKVAHEPAYPLLGETYQECKKRELSLGLDLKGGMAVTLEVSIPDLVMNLSGKSKNADFKKAYENAFAKWKLSPSEDFIDLFYSEYLAVKPEGRLASIFSMANRDKFNAKASNEEIIAKIKSEKESAMSNIEQIMNNRINKFGVSNATLQRLPGSGRIMIELPGVKDKLRVRSLLQSTANLEFWHTYNNHEIAPAFENVNAALSKALYPDFVMKNGKGDTTSKFVLPDSATLAAMDSTSRDSVMALAAADTTSKPTNDSLSNEELYKQFPMAKYLQYNIRPANPEDENAGNVWAGGSCIGYCSLADTARLNTLLNHPAAKAIWPKDLRLLWGAKVEGNAEQTTNLLPLYAIKVTTRNGVAPLDGSAVTEARYDYGEFGNTAEVVMQMNQKGAETWADLTGAAFERKAAIAIVMDNYVYSAPMVNGKITGGRSSIEGNFTIDEATDLANILKSGTLPARAEIVDEVIVGPSLGASNIDSGLNSFLLALLVVLIYMYVYYKKAGMIANISLIMNLFFLVGALASIQASLTLPGIAGIVLTMGMAVDANVLIYERIREELRQGKSLKLAVNEGFSRALSSIIDGNLTTLLTAIVLATFGSGPILGFATTLIIGIFTSLFSAIFISRLIIQELLERKKDISFSTKLTENIFIGAKYNFMGRRKLFYLISSLVILIGIGSLFVRGLDYGVEFTGGRTYEIEFKEEAQYDKIRENLANVFVENGQKLTPEVKLIENKFKAKITTKYLFNDTSATAGGRVDAALIEGLKEWKGNYTILQQRQVGAVVSGEFIESAIVSIFFSLVIIFVYVYIRFRRWQFGLAAVLALFHDAMLVVGVFSLCYGFLPFSMEIDQAFIAAILTVVGYSINDTVVVFDRIREYINENKRMESYNMINLALNSTLSRTINTSVTTLIVLVVIFIFGGEAIKGFTFALLVGIGVGTYSSLCVASPLVYDFAGSKLTSFTSASATTKKTE